MVAISGKRDEADLDTLPPETLAALRATAALFPSGIVESEVGEIPEGWSPGSFGEIAVQRRRNASAADIDPEEPYVGLENFTRASLALFDWGVGRGLESQKFRFERGEVLFGKLRPYFHKVCIAPVSGVCSTDVVVLSPIRPEWTSYMRLVVSEPAMIEHATALSDGTRMPRASWGDLSIFPVVKPPQELAARFDGVVGPMLDTLTLLPHESRTLATLRDTLLPKLLAGEMKVGCAAEQAQPAGMSVE
jgi:type I restriction enzyme S subunit